MASLLDISLLDQFSVIFVILFVFTAVYAVLSFRKPFGEAKGINALLAFTIAIMFIFSQDAIEVIKASIPWYIVMMIAIMFIFIIPASIGSTVPQSFMKNVGNYVLIIGIVILVINVANRLGQGAGPFLSNESINPDQVVAGESGDVGTGSFSQNFGATFFHPKVLALILVLVICLFAVMWIGYSPPFPV